MFTSSLLLHIPGLNCLWWLLLAMLLPLLLGLLLGYWLWYQYKQRSEDLELERDKQHARLNDMEKNHAELKYKHDELQKDNNALRTSLNAAEADLAVLRTKLQRLQSTEKQEQTPVGRGVVGAGAFDFAALFSSDDLQVIEGIGPMIEAVLHKSGIKNWGMLAAKSPDEIKEVLHKAGSAYRLQNPKSWPEQAKLADQGKWKELVEYQKFLDTGREDKGDFETPAKIEVLAKRRQESAGGTSSRAVGGLTFAGVFSNDNLQIIEGIGPKIEALLKEAGINNWQQLAQASPETLSAKLEAAGSAYRVHNPETWPRQAQLAHEGKWEELVEYQQFLDAGRGDKGDFKTPSKMEKMAAQILGFSGAKPEDLKIVEGIGPKIEQLLKDAGIKNWSDLAATTVDEIKEILSGAGNNFRLANPESWPNQARLAAQGNWKALKDYQDFLQGGKTPGE